MADVAMAGQLSHRQRLQSRGVHIGAPGQANRARFFRGMVIASCPDPVMIATAENVPGTRGVATVALHNEHLLEWVNTYAPRIWAETP